MITLRLKWLIFCQFLTRLTKVTRRKHVNESKFIGNKLPAIHGLILYNFSGINIQKVKFWSFFLKKKKKFYFPVNVLHCV